MQNKFDDLKHRVDAGSERFNQCNEFAKKLLASESPYINDIEKSQEKLRYLIHFNHLYTSEKYVHSIHNLHMYEVILENIFFKNSIDNNYVVSFYF